MVKCKYPDCDGGPVAGYCHTDCRLDAENFATCPECGGEGGQEVPKPTRDDPYLAVWQPCGTCNQSGFV